MPIALLFMFAALAIITPTLMSGVQQDNQLIIGTVAAKQLHQITDAAKGYITSYAANIETQATSSTPAVITVADLENTGFLPQGFNTINPYGQTWEVEVLQPTNGNLDALVLSVGGQPIPPADAPRIASESGAAGGIVQANNTAQGAYGGWTVSMAGYTNPGTGHLAGLIGYSNGQLQSDYLYRVAVPGQPQLNTMQTNLDMGANDINNVHDVQAGVAGQCVDDADGHCDGQIEAAGTSQSDLPKGWFGGITTRDLYGVNGTVAEGTGNGASPQATLSDYGNGTAGTGGVVDVNAPNGNYASMNASATGSNPEIDTNGIIDAGNGFGAGNYFGMDNGSWYAYNNGDTDQNGNASVQGQVSAGNIYISGSTGTNNPSGGSSGYLGFTDDPNVYVGGTCGNAIGEPATALASNAQGQILQCYGRTWQTLGGLGSGPYYYSLPTWNGSSTGEQIPGSWAYCAMASVGTTGKNDGENFNDGVEEVSPGIWDMWGEAVTAACYQ